MWDGSLYENHFANQVGEFIETALQNVVTHIGDLVEHNGNGPRGLA